MYTYRDPHQKVLASVLLDIRVIQGYSELNIEGLTGCKDPVTWDSMV